MTGRERNQATKTDVTVEEMYPKQQLQFESLNQVVPCRNEVSWPNKEWDLISVHLLHCSVAFKYLMNCPWDRVASSF